MVEKHILNLGAGVQSTCLYLSFLKGVITPTIDCAIFADTQVEPKSVYTHLVWLQSLNGPTILVRTKGHLGHDLVQGMGDKKRFAQIPCYTADTEGIRSGRTRRQCTAEYKINVIEKTIKREILALKKYARLPKNVKVYQYFGISTDEESRATRIYERWMQGKAPFEPKFPLLDMKMSRQDCVSWLTENGPQDYTVPRSACTFCPFHSDEEWLRIKTEDPDAWSEAVAMDSALRTEGTACNRGMDKKLYLHRSVVPLDQIDFSSAITSKERIQGHLDKKPWESECLGMCGM